MTNVRSQPKAPRRSGTYLVRTSLGLGCLLGAVACGPPPSAKEPATGDPVAAVSAEQLFRTGVALGQRGDHVRAEQYLVSAREQGYPEDEVLPALIQTCLAASRLQAALGYATPYLERHPHAWPLRYLVASIHLGLGHAERSREELEAVLDVAPDAPEPHFLLARVLRSHLDDPEAAAPHFERYLELAPNGERAAEARQALGEAHSLVIPTRADPPPEGRPAQYEPGDLERAGDGTP